MSMSINNHAPFFNLIRNNKGFEWTNKCEEASKKLKEYLTTPPILTQPKPRETLYIYLALSNKIVNLVLIKEERDIQKLIYFTN